MCVCICPVNDLTIHLSPSTCLAWSPLYTDKSLKKKHGLPTPTPISSFPFSLTFPLNLGQYIFFFLYIFLTGPLSLCVVIFLHNEKYLGLHPERKKTKRKRNCYAEMLNFFYGISKFVGNLMKEYI